MNILKLTTTIFIFSACILALGLLIKGTPLGQNKFAFQTPASRHNLVGSPFESSGSSSRYALTEAMVDRGSIYFTYDQARFASPDVGRYDGEYFSLFPPGVSAFAVPFYWLGRQINMPQLFTFSSSLFLAVLNAILVAKLARVIGVGYYASILSGQVFLFATNALVYALTLTQHHLSTTLILFGVLSAVGRRTWINNIWFGMLYSAALAVDLPNAIIMLPLVIYILSRQFQVSVIKSKFKVKLRLNAIALLVGLLPLIFALGWYNNQLTGSPAKLPQFIGRTHDFNINARQLTDEDGGTTGSIIPFNLRHQIQGIFILLVSNQSGLLVYSPIILLGFYGIYLSYQRADASRRAYTIVFTAVFFANFLLYSMFGDPTGGWSFGARYLIPGVSILAIFTGTVLSRYRTRLLFTLGFGLLALYSLGVNVLGAVTTAQVPPRVEAIALPDPLPYTYEYNWQLIQEQGLNSSLLYQLLFASRLDPIEFAAIYTLMLFIYFMIIYLLSITDGKKIYNKLHSPNSKQIQKIKLPNINTFSIWNLGIKNYLKIVNQKLTI